MRMDPQNMFELLQNEEDELDRAIICHQYGVAIGEIDLMDLSIWAIQDASREATREEIGERLFQCLNGKCKTDAARLWACYLLAALDMLTRPTDDSLKMPMLEEILKYEISPSLICLVNWLLISWYSRTDQVQDAMRLYAMELDEIEASRLKRGKIFALFDLWAAVFACDWILDEFQSMSHDEPIANCLWLFSKGEITYVMQDFNECLNLHQQAIVEVEKIKPSEIVRKISGVHSMETRLEGFLRFIKTRSTARITNCKLSSDQQEYFMDFVRIPVLSPDGILCKVVNPYVLGVLSAAQMPLFRLLRQEKNFLNRAILQHQCAIAGDGTFVTVNISVLFTGNGKPYKKSESVSPTGLQLDCGIEELLHEKIVRCLEEKCKIEGGESKAWAFYYVGMLLPDSKAHNLKQSLQYGKSPVLRYLACKGLDEIITQPDERLDNSKERVKSAEGAMLISARIQALYDLWLDYESLAMFKEAGKTQSELENIDNNDLAKGVSLYCKGRLAGKMGSYKEAMNILRKAIPILEKVPVKRIVFGIIDMKAIFATHVADKISEAKGLVWLFQLEDGQGNEKDFEKNYQKDLFAHTPTHNSDLYDMFGMGFLEGKARLMLKKGEVEEAKATLLKILSFSESDPRCSASYATALLLLLSIACESANKEEMESIFYKLEKLEQDQGAVRTIAENSATAYFSMGEYDKAIENLKTAITIDMDIANRSDLSALRISYIDYHKRAFRNMQKFIISTQSSNPDFISKALVWAERERARDFLLTIQQKEAGSYLRSDLIARFDSDDDAALSEIRSISADAGDKTVFIVFSKPTEDMGLMSVSNPDEPKHRVSMLSYYVRAGEEPWLQMSVHEHKVAPKTWEIEDLKTFYKIYLQGVEERLEKAEIKRIVFVTTEEVALIPFAALIDSQEKYLIEKYEISTIASLRLFKHCEKRRRDLMEKRESTEALIVANPQDNLPSAEKEGLFVDDILKKASLSPILLKGDAATKTEVVTRLPQSCWIHVCCHAIIDKKVPSGALNLRSQLCDMVCDIGALEVANDLPSERGDIQTATTTKKNLLTAEEIHEGKDLRAVVTVLGACNSGKGQYCAEGTLGLARSFHLAGVPTVVAALWKVDDEATADLMKLFYINMCKGLSIAGALREAMRYMKNKLDESNEAKYTPSQWAPFFISGSPFSSMRDILASSFKDDS